jgi:hypothetical protein
MCMPFLCSYIDPSLVLLKSSFHDWPFGCEIKVVQNHKVIFSMFID